MKSTFFLFNMRIFFFFFFGCKSSFYCYEILRTNATKTKPFLSHAYYTMQKTKKQKVSYKNLEFHCLCILSYILQPIVNLYNKKKPTPNFIPLNSKFKKRSRENKKQPFKPHSQTNFLSLFVSTPSKNM